MDAEKQKKIQAAINKLDPIVIGDRVRVLNHGMPTDKIGVVTGLYAFHPHVRVKFAPGEYIEYRIACLRKVKEESCDG